MRGRSGNVKSNDLTNSDKRQNYPVQVTYVRVQWECASHINRKGRIHLTIGRRTELYAREFLLLLFRHFERQETEIQGKAVIYTAGRSRVSGDPSCNILSEKQPKFTTLALAAFEQKEQQTS